MARPGAGVPASWAGAKEIRNRNRVCNPYWLEWLKNNVEAEMKKPAWIPIRACLSFFLFFLNGCQTNPAPTITPTVSPVNTSTYTLTYTPSRTKTPTATPTATDTPMITPTFTSTPAYHLPGLYYSYKCTDFQPAGIPVCITVIFVSKA